MAEAELTVMRRRVADLEKREQRYMLAGPYTRPLFGST